MFEPTSRYAGIKDVSFVQLDEEGRPLIIVYKQRRFLPNDEGSATLVEHTVQQADRLDNITAHYLGDPTLFWRVCDANGVLKPTELEELGMIVRIALPGF